MRGHPIKIVSGGQTGVDRAVLDAAMEAGLPVGGWCPRGRRAEDGPIAARYPLRETPTAEYAERTCLNVGEGDATLVLGAGGDSPGTALTAREAARRNKPLLHAHLDESAETAAAWLRELEVHVLNVAGPRESEVPGIYRRTLVWMRALLREIGKHRIR